LVIERRRCVLLRFDEEVELGLLSCGRLKLEDHAVKTRVSVDGSEIKLCARQRMHVAGEGDEWRLIWKVELAIHLAIGRNGKSGHEENNSEE